MPLRALVADRVEEEVEKPGDQDQLHQKYEHEGFWGNDTVEEVGAAARRNADAYRQRRYYERGRGLRQEADAMQAWLAPTQVDFTTRRRWQKVVAALEGGGWTAQAAEREAAGVADLAAAAALLKQAAKKARRRERHRLHETPPIKVVHPRLGRTFSPATPTRQP